VEPIDVFALGDALLARGWHHDRQGPPDSLHSTVSNSNTGVIDQYLRDLRECVAEIAGRRADDRSTTYSTVEYHSSLSSAGLDEDEVGIAVAILDVDRRIVQRAGHLGRDADRHAVHRAHLVAAERLLDEAERDAGLVAVLCDGGLRPASVDLAVLALPVGARAA
jgi:hypothetical protein